MTSRLKRKLNDLGVDPSSSKANESFCLIGTPLPPLEKSKDTGEFVPLWKQEVKDEKGRRRLHGAFTGGFSAGYFNTVGSKEGWTPSTFVSSRSDRVKQKVARPEDYMDEEDLAEFRDAQKLVDENEEMDLTGGTQAELRAKANAAETEKDSMALTLEEALLPTPKDSAGARILKKMGWRPGQGIGPRLTWRQHKIQDLQASSGYLIAQDDIKLDEDNEDEEAKKHTYPRRDTPVLSTPRKENSHGIGYIPGMSLNDTLDGAKSTANSGRQISAGFGLGALNDADEDDLDVYESGFPSSKNRVAYEDVDPEDLHTTIGNRKARTRKESTRIPSTTIQTFSDGRPLISGFILSDKSVVEDRWFPLQDVPSGWKPDPQRVWQQEKSGKENDSNAVSSKRLAGQSWRDNMSADQRGTILGETPIPSKPRSVFEYISQKDRDRLRGFVPPDRQNIAPPSDSALPSPQPEQVKDPASFTYPRIEPQVAKAALSGFKPFTSDPVKQARYTAYLQSQSQASGENEQRQLKQTPGQDLEHFQRELEEYAQAAIVFKPLSGAMAGRFTSATVVDNAAQVIEGLHTPVQEPPKADPVPEPKAEEKEQDAKTHAATNGMYGSLTREVVPWQPAKLLCKRFGVKEPEIEQTLETTQASGSTSAKNWEPETDLAEAQLVTVGASTQSLDVARSNGGSGRRDFANIGMGEDETQGRDTLTYERPGKDIFKAIFASDDEDSDDEIEGSNEKDEDQEMPPPLLPPSQSANNSIKVEPARNTATETVDLSSFKPKFVPRAEREGDQTASLKKRKKDKEKKKGGKVLVSFEVEEEDNATPPTRERNRKKRKSKHPDKVEDDDGMWVEKPVPDVVQSLGTTPVEQKAMENTAKGKEEGTTRMRKRAIDFL